MGSELVALLHRDDSARDPSRPEVVGSSVGLVSRNALMGTCQTDRDHATLSYSYSKKLDPFREDGHPERSQGGYAGNWARKPPSLAVALNCGTGSSFLNALVKAFDRLHMVLAENSAYCGSK
jgi:hypothetical protein